MDQLNRQIHDRLDRINKSLAARGNVDRHNEHFQGRTIELRRLREQVGLGKLGVLTAVHGLGGMGKTALATEYAYAFAHEYPAGRWQIRCEGRDDLRSAFVSLAGVRDFEFEFSEDEQKNLDLGFERVLRELENRARAVTPSCVLVILDNVDQPSLLAPAQVARLPRAEWLHLIATTRLGESDLFGAQRDRAFLPVDELPEADALELIASFQPGRTFREAADREAAREMVNLLGRFPLAVEAAAVYLGQVADDVTFAGFRDRLKAEGLAGLEGTARDTAGGTLHGETSLRVTLRPTLERLDEPARMALAFAALLPADHVPLPWLRALVAQPFPDLGRDAAPGYPDPWQALLRRLLGLRLLQPTGVRDAQGAPLVARIHRLVQEVVRLEGGELVTDLEPPLLAYIKERAKFLWDGWVQHEHRWELAPLTACADHWLERGDDGPWLAFTVAGPLQHLGNFAAAERLNRRAVERTGPDNPDFAARISGLALLLWATNRLAEAEKLFRRALAIDEASYGPDHPDVAIRLNNLAGLMYATKRLAEAEPLCLRMVEIFLEFTRATRHEHPHLRASINHYAGLLAAMGRSQVEIKARLEEMERKFGVSLVRGAYSGQEPRPGLSVLGTHGQLARKLLGR